MPVNCWDSETTAAKVFPGIKFVDLSSTRNTDVIESKKIGFSCCTVFAVLADGTVGYVHWHLNRHILEADEGMIRALSRLGVITPEQRKESIRFVREFSRRRAVKKFKGISETFLSHAVKALPSNQYKELRSAVDKATPSAMRDDGDVS